MRLLGNILWLVLGGFGIAMGYFIGSLFLAVTIVGLPLAWQTFRLGMLCLWPFGTEVVKGSSDTGCLTLFLNAVWIVFGGFWTMLGHLFWGILLSITIIGLPWGKQHFKLAALSLTPFGYEIRRK